LRSALAAQVAEHLVPAAFVVLDHLPLTANGKLDRDALPAPETAGTLREAYVPPDTHDERLLCDVWQRVLGLERIGIEDNYFAVGGDSIRSLQIVRLARERGLALCVADVFRYQTIRLLATRARAAEASPLTPVDLRRLETSLSTNLPNGLSDVYPLTAMQSLMVRAYADPTRTGEGVYHVQQYFRFYEPAPSPDAMRAAFELLAKSHPILRTVLVHGEEGELLQGVRDEIVLDFAEEALPNADESGQMAWLSARVASDRSDAFRLGDPLFRVRWFATGPGRFDLLLSIHHAVDDGWGNQNFLAELFGLYKKLSQGERVSLPTRANVFKEYVALEREAADSAAAHAFWTPRLARPPSRGFARRSGPADAAGVLSLRIDADRTAGLQRLARDQSVSLKAVLLAGYLRMVGDGCEAADPCVGVVSNGRSERLSDPLGGLGLFWNLLPFRTELLPSGETAVASATLVRAVQDELSAMESFALYPASSIAEQLHGTAPFQATFNFIDFHNVAQLESDDSLVLAYQDGHDKFHSPLNYAFSVDRAEGTVLVRVEFDPAYFDAPSVASLNRRLLHEIDVLAGRGQFQHDPSLTSGQYANPAVEMTCQANE
jgi:hypothetical protein